MTYDIQNIDQLENSAANLATYNQTLANDINSLQYIINQIKANWQNEAGTDLASIISELEDCLNILNNAITPTLSKYVTTMNTLVAESRTTQSKSIG